MIHHTTAFVSLLPGLEVAEYLLQYLHHFPSSIEAPDLKNNQPHIVLFQDGDEDDATRQFLIAVEQHLLIEVSNTVGAIFYLLAAHYVFNVAYHNKAKDVLLFLQSKVFTLPCTDGKRSATNMAHKTGIVRYMQHDDDNETWNSDCKVIFGLLHYWLFVACIQFILHAF